MYNDARRGVAKDLSSQSTSDVILTVTITIVIILIIIFKNDKLLPFNCCLKVNKSLLLINMWDAAGFLFCMKKQVFLASLYNL